MTRRAALYARVSTRNGHQDPEVQLMALRQVARRTGWQVVEEYVDHGISGAKGRDKRPAFDRLLKDATRRRLTSSWPGASTVWVGACRPRGFPRRRARARDRPLP